MVCDDLPDLRYGVEGATGQLFAGKTPIICGGYPNNCGCQEFENDAWVVTQDPLQCREFAASAILKTSEAKSVLIIGRGYYGEELNLTETYDGTTWKSKLSESLIERVYGHCIVQVDSSTLISIGGITDSKYVGNTYLLDATVNKWTPGSSLHIPRSGLSCGILKWRNPDTNTLENILVAAGGHNED